MYFKLKITPWSIISGGLELFKSWFDQTEKFVDNLKYEAFWVSDSFQAGLRQILHDPELGITDINNDAAPDYKPSYYWFKHKEYPNTRYGIYFLGISALVYAQVDTKEKLVKYLKNTIKDILKQRKENPESFIDLRGND